MKQKTCDIFLSYSGASGELFANLLKKLLCSIYGFADKQIFFAKQDLHGRIDWIERLQEEANSCKIGISCLTKESYNREWILFELGAMNRNALVIPVAIDFSLDVLKSNGSGSEMFMRHQCKSSYDRTRNNEKTSNNTNLKSIDFLLKEIFQELENESNAKIFRQIINSHPQVCFEDYLNKNRVEYNEQLDEFVKSYQSINTSYSCFISRPMRGYEDHDKLTEFLSELVLENKNIYFSTRTTQMAGKESVKLSTIRIENIRKSASFILIFPKINGEQPPSSCLIEFGAALSLDREVKVFAEEGAILPFFLEKMEDIIERYRDWNHLRSLLSSYLKLEERS